MASFSLTVSGDVKTYAKVFPSRVRMRGKVNEVETKEISITPSDEFVFKILKTSFLQETDLTCSVETKKEKKNLKYILTLTSPNQKSGRYHNTLVVQTNHPKMPKIKIPVTGYVTDLPKVSQPVKPKEPSKKQGQSG